MSSSQDWQRSPNRPNSQRQTKEFLTVDGSWLAIETSRNVPSFEATGFTAWITSNRTGVNRVSSAEAGTNELAPDVEIVAEAKVGRATVLSLTYPEIDEPQFTTFVYRRDHGEVVVTNGGVVSLDTFESFLRDWSFVDGRDGIAMRPRAGSNATVKTTFGTTYLVSVADLDFHLGESVHQLQPAAAGKAVAGGRLWRIDDAPEPGDESWSRAEGAADPADRARDDWRPTAERLHLLLGSDTALTEIWADDDADPSQITTLADSLRVEAATR